MVRTGGWRGTLLPTLQWIEAGLGPLYRRIFVEAALPIRP
jgi:hypothetical protein